MAQQTINTGLFGTIRAAINANFTELYNSVASAIGTANSAQAAATAASTTAATASSAATSATATATSAASAASAAQATANAALPAAQKGAASGVATLGSDSKVPQGQMTGKLAMADLTDSAAILAAKQNVAINWNGTTPALVSSTNPVPAFGSNAYVYTGAGGATLDGNVYQTGDEAIWNGSSFTCVRLGGGYLGAFASSAALQTAYPAASNPACCALVAGAYFVSNGTAWAAPGGAVASVAGRTGTVVLSSADLSDNASLERLVGIFGSSGALQTAFPAASNTGNKALVGASAPYVNYSSNGSAWVKGVSASTDLSDAASLLSASSLTGGTLAAGRLPALTGDVTSSAGSAATTLSPTAAALTIQTTNAQTGTTYTFALADAGQNVDLSNASPITATIPPHSTIAYPNGTVLYWTQAGVGIVTIAPGAAVTFDHRASQSLSTSERLAGGYAVQMSQDNWRIYNF